MTMITVTNTKGGTGKTTSSFFLALAASNANPNKRVVLVDTDPQQSAAQWYRIAQSNGENPPFSLEIMGADKASKLLNSKDSIYIIDTATSDGKGLVKLSMASDLVVVPTQAEGLGVARTYPTLQVMGDKGAVLLTQVHPRQKLYAIAKDALEQAGASMFETEIPDRVIYKAYGTIPRTAAAYVDVWREIEEELGR